jgi:hypothetical protein
MLQRIATAAIAMTMRTAGPASRTNTISTALFTLRYHCLDATAHRIFSALAFVRHTLSGAVYSSLTSAENFVSTRLTSKLQHAPFIVHHYDLIIRFGCLLRRPAHGSPRKRAPCGGTSLVRKPALSARYGLQDVPAARSMGIKSHQHFRKTVELFPCLHLRACDNKAGAGQTSFTEQGQTKRKQASYRFQSSSLGQSLRAWPLYCLISFL